MSEYTCNKLAGTAGDFILICAATFLCFLPGIGNGFVQTWDDSFYVVNNEHIRTLSLDTIRWAFSETYAFFWGPVTWLSLAADYSFWGLNPIGYHLTNAAIHAFNAGMFYILSNALITNYLALYKTGETTPSGITHQNSRYCSILAALIFALHPLRVESVAWATERKDVLSLLFGICSILAYIRYAGYSAPSLDGQRPRLSFATSRYYWLSFAFFVLSLFSKSTLVTLPLILLILDWFPLNRNKHVRFSERLVEKLPFIAFTIAISLLIMTMNASSMMPFSESNLLSRVLIAFKSYWGYLKHTLYPLNLSPFYPHPGNVTSISLDYIFSIVVFTAITACGIIMKNSRPIILAVWLTYLVLLLPVIGIVQAAYTSMADRFTYLPSLPVSLFIATTVTVIMSKFPPRSYRFYAGMLVIGIALISCSCLTIRQLRFWKDDVSLWSRAIALNPHTTGKMYTQRANGHVIAGNDPAALHDMNEAISIAARRKYIRIHELYAKRAQINQRLGNLAEAIADYSNALDSDSSTMRIFYLQARGSIYRELGMMELSERDNRMASELQSSR